MLASKAGTGAIGVDLSASTLTTAFKSTGFTVDGSGNITGAVGTLNHLPCQQHYPCGRRDILDELVVVSNRVSVRLVEQRHDG